MLKIMVEFDEYWILYVDPRAQRKRLVQFLKQQRPFLQLAISRRICHFSDSYTAQKELAASNCLSVR